MTGHRSHPPRVGRAGADYLADLIAETQAEAPLSALNPTAVRSSDRSVQERLLAHAGTMGVEQHHVLVRYAAERLLYRLSQSPYVDRFVLRGSLLMLAWLGEGIRPSRDVDLLALDRRDADTLAGVFAEIATVPVAPDGLTFVPGSVRVAALRPEDPHGGQRLRLSADLAGARMKLQIDVAVGDSIFPGTQWMDYPTMLDMPHPRLRASRPETVIAEKVHAMVVRGSKNTRLRDFFDVHALSCRRSFDGKRLARTIEATFMYRDTPLPPEPPPSLTPAFAADKSTLALWRGFLRRSRLPEATHPLGPTLATIASFLTPILTTLARREPFTGTWPPGGPWQ